MTDFQSGVTRLTDTVFQVPTNLPSTHCGDDAWLSFTWNGGDASYRSELGIYRVDDASGRIGNLLPGDTGYAQKALEQSRATSVFDRYGSYRPGATVSVQVERGGFYGTYLIQNGDRSGFRQSNPNNSTSRSPVAFFSTTRANPDGFDHLQASFMTDASGKVSLRQNWEDTTGGGDRDFNDVMFTVAGITPVQVAAAGGTYRYQAQASDVEGDALSYSLVQAPQGASIDAVTARSPGPTRPRASGSSPSRSAMVRAASRPRATPWPSRRPNRKAPRTASRPTKTRASPATCCATTSPWRTTPSPPC